MAKRKKVDSPQSQKQPYDSLLKSVLAGQEKQMLPYFCEGAEYLETLDIEATRTILRVDRVYKILYKGGVHILHLEFETHASTDMGSRLADYHTYLYHNYQIPVISMIVYPFRVTMAASPFQEQSGDEDIVTFHFRILALWKLSAEEYIRGHNVLMYAFLPTMVGANTYLLNQAIDELIAYYEGNDVRLAQELKWIGVVLRRADTIPIDVKQEIERRLDMYDDLIERDPKMQKMRAKMKSEGRVEGRVEGRTEGLQQAVMRIIRKRFPALTEEAQGSVKQITKTDALDLLLDQLIEVTDEASARALLTSRAA